MNKGILKRAVTVLTLSFFILTIMGFNFSPVSGTDAVRKKILVVAPHEDDESIACAGIIKSAVDRGDDVRVMYFTNGDAMNLAETRAGEAVTAMARLGLSKDKLYYLSYGDFTVLDGLYLSKNAPTTEFTSIYGYSETYGFPGVLEDYHYLMTGTHARYNRENVLSDIQDVINKFRPDDIYMPSAFEWLPDHKATSLFTTEAIMNIKDTADYSPVIHEYMVYKYGLPQAGVDYNALPVPYTNDTANMDYTSPYNWAERESVPVPAEMSDLQTYLKKIDLTGAQIAVNDSYSPDNGAGRVFDGDVFSSYTSNGTEVNTTITVTLPDQKNIESIEVLTEEIAPASTFITIEAADTPEDLANETQSYVSLVQNLESRISDWEAIRTYTANNLKIWRFTFHSSVADNLVNVREIQFRTGNMKAAVLRDYVSQFGIEERAMADEIFWKKTMSSLSYSAFTSASSESYPKQQFSGNVNDGVVLGDGMYKNRNDAYMQDPTRTYDETKNMRNAPFEWVVLGETKKAWVQLTWMSGPVTANRIVLYDRPDLDENILNARLTFSDGSEIKNIGPLNKNGSPTVFDFETKTFSWVKLTTQKAEGTNTGLAEFEVYNMP